MPTLKDWDDEATRLSIPDAIKYANAIKILREWEFFDKAYEWTGYRVVGHILEHRVQKPVSQQLAEMETEPTSDQLEEIRKAKIRIVDLFGG